MSVKHLFTLLIVVAFHSVFAQVIDPRLRVDAKLAPFYHGVASGDPLQDKVIIWTRVSPQNASSQMIEVNWRVATDTNMLEVVQSGVFLTNANRDYTVKVDVGGLNPATTYYFDFEALDRKSLIGRTRTAPEADEVESLRFGVVSCSNYEYGYFNAYRDLKNRNDVDAIIHLGDYFYEYEVGGYSSNIEDRTHLPEGETINLDDYRLRHSHYKLDPDLKDLHQQFPFITVWDDHESTDNSHRDGANNHQPATEGDWFERKASAIQAYMEWMPIREAANGTSIYRTFRYGDLADIYMLDTRLEDRDEQVAIGSADANSEERRLLGDTQFNWLVDEVRNSNAKWQVFGQQVMMAPLRVGGVAINMDQWDGYTFERDRLLNFFSEEVENAVVLTGDIHSSWANDLPMGLLYSTALQQGSAGVEFVCTSVTSPGLDIPAGASVVQLNNPHMQYIDLVQKGYMILNLGKDAVQADWFYSETVAEQNATHNFGTGYMALVGEPYLSEAEKSTSPTRALDPLAPAQPQGGFSSIENDFPFAVFGMYPNPFSTSFKMQFYASKMAPFRVMLVDEQGRTLKSIVLTPKVGVNYAEVKTQDIPSGLYTVTLESEGQVKGFSMIKK